MAVKIRLTRMGRKKAPYYRVVVADSRYARDGRFLEILGYYHPLEKEDEKQLKVDADKALNWMKEGARPSDTVRTLFARLGIMKRFHENRKKPAKATAESGAS